MLPFISLVYLLSNNYINDLITYKWDFTNEDVLANYVSFLKTISLKLNPRTIQFFFNNVGLITCYYFILSLIN